MWKRRILLNVILCFDQYHKFYSVWQFLYTASVMQKLHRGLTKEYGPEQVWFSYTFILKSDLVDIGTEAQQTPGWVHSKSVIKRRRGRARERDTVRERKVHLIQRGGQYCEAPKRCSLYTHTHTHAHAHNTPRLQQHNPSAALYTCATTRMNTHPRTHIHTKQTSNTLPNYSNTIRSLNEESLVYTQTATMSSL